VIFWSLVGDKSHPFRRKFHKRFLSKHDIILSRRLCVGVFVA